MFRFILALAWVAAVVGLPLLLWDTHPALTPLLLVCLGQWLMGIWLPAAAITQTCLGSRPRVLSFGLGWPIARFEVRGVSCRISAFPLGGYVRTHTDDLEAEPGGPPPAQRSQLASLLAHLTLAVPAALILGPSGLASRLLEAGRLWPLGIARPLSVGRDALQRLACWPLEHDLPEVLGFLAVLTLLGNLVFLALQVPGSPDETRRTGRLRRTVGRLATVLRLGFMLGTWIAGLVALVAAVVFWPGACGG